MRNDAGGVGLLPLRTPLPVPGGALLALRMSLRARGLRGLDVLRRSQDRAPPGAA
jgi:hypothetical protein